MLLTPIKLKSHRKNSFSSQKDNNPPDLYFYIGKEIIPACRHRLLESLDSENLDEESQFIKQNNNNKLADKCKTYHNLSQAVMFEKIVSFLQSYIQQLNITNSQQLQQTLNILHYLCAKQHIQQIQDILQLHLSQYDIFPLLSLAYRHNLQKVFDQCIELLEVNQFEQIKYNKFDFLQCDFKLFQIVLRRHHILKVKEEIQGLDFAEIQEVIRSYCARNRFDQETLKRLLNKYVFHFQKDQFEKYQKAKISLRLEKLAHKKILQSANIDTDFYDNDGIEDMKQKWKNSTIKFHKYSLQMRQQQRLIAQNKAQLSYFDKIKQDEVQSIFRESSKKSQQNNNEYQIKISGKSQPKIQWGSIKDKETPHSQPRRQEEAVSEVVMSGYTGILNKHEKVLNQHDLKYKRMRRNSRSLLFHELQIENENVSKAKLINSSNLVGFNNLFTIFDSKKQA